MGTRSLWMNRYELYFGQERRSGRPVRYEEFMEFFYDAPLPHLPGWTFYEGLGGYKLKEDGSLKTEFVKVLVVVAPDDPELWKVLRKAAQEYARQFDQESVMCLRTELDAVAFQGP